MSRVNARPALFWGAHATSRAGEGTSPSRTFLQSFRVHTKSWPGRKSSLRRVAATSTRGRVRSPETLRRALDHLSVPEPDGAFREPCYIGIMRYEDERGAGAAIQFEHDLDDGAARFRVEISSRLIGE
jgi:hypothetical protein